MEGASLPYEVVSGTSERGRMVVAMRPLVPGELILRERAIACVAVCGRPLCDDCLEKANEDSRCVTCGGNFVSGSRRACVPPPVRLAAKLLRRRQEVSLGHEQASSIDGLLHGIQSYATHDHRIANEEDIYQVVKAAAELETCSSMTVQSSLHFLSHQYGGISARSLLLLAEHVLSRVLVNAINTCDGDGATGLGLFMGAAMFNHDCCPNVQAWWKGAKIELRCTKAVPSGEELCLSYVAVDQPSFLRRPQLSSSQWDAELTGLKCPSRGCTGAVSRPCSGGGDMFCNKCGEGTTVADRPSAGMREQEPRGSSIDEADAPCSDGGRTTSGRADVARRLTRAEQKFNEGMDAYNRGDAEAALSALEESLRTRDILLHAHNKDLLRALRYASYASVALHKWFKARLFLLRWLHPMETMYSAAEIWDIAGMRIDLGLVLLKLSTSTGHVPDTPLPQTARSFPEEVTSRARGSMHPVAFSHIRHGMLWLWACLGKDTGLPAEAAALEACAEHGATL